MIVVKKILSTGSYDEVEYPRNDLEPIYKLDSDIRYYKIIESDKPEYNPLTHKLSFKDSFEETESHFGNYYKSWFSEKLTDDEIINNLTNSCEDCIELYFPQVKQIDLTTRYIYLFQLQLQGVITNDELDEMKYIGDVDTWGRNVRKEKTRRITDLLTNGILPSFEWEAMPIRD